MNSFFHAYTKKYERRFRYAAGLAAAPFAELSMMCIWSVLFNLRSVFSGSFFLPLAILLCSCIAAAMLLCWIFRGICDKAISRNAKYTFFDICKTHAVYSRYSGEFRNGGKRTIMRTLYVVPLKSFTGVFLDEKKKHLILTGEIRVYFDETEKLGYHIKDGALDFDSWWYNENGYKKIGMLRMHSDFERPALVARSLHEAKTAFDAIPEKKPYVFREADIVRRRRELKKMAEKIRYEKKW